MAAMMDQEADLERNKWGLKVATRWTLAEAGAEFSALSELAERHGFRLSMFGSVLQKGEGRDLDLLLSPFGSLPQHEVRFLAEFGGVLKASRLSVPHNVRAFEVERNGRLYDFVFGGFWKPRR
jgi:hypothetical protein